MNAPAHRRRADQRGAPQTWTTPPALVRALEARYTRDGFDLDAAADARNTIAEHWLGPGSSIAEDALDHRVRWAVPGVEVAQIFCNPPWDAIGEWVDAALAMVLMGLADPVVLLLPTRADTAWWRDLECPPAGVISQRDQIEGRVAYVDPTGARRSAPAEGSTVWVLRPVLRASELRGAP